MPDAVTREKVLSAEPAEAWNALTDPERMANWLGEPIEALRGSTVIVAMPPQRSWGGGPIGPEQLC